MSKDVGELGDVLFDAVKRAGKEVAQVMREHLVRIHVRVIAKGFHFPPDIRPADRLAAAGDKDRACCNVLFFGVLQQLFL